MFPFGKVRGLTSARRLLLKRAAPIRHLRAEGIHFDPHQVLRGIAMGVAHKINA